MDKFIQFEEMFQELTYEELCELYKIYIKIRKQKYQKSERWKEIHRKNALKSYHKNKENEEYRKKHKENSRRYYYNNLEICRQKQRERNREYYAKNRETILEKAKVKH